MNLRRLLLAAFLLANAPVAAWYIRRTADGSDEPLGLLALAAACYFLWSERRDLKLNPWVLGVGAAVLVLTQFALLHRAPLLLGAITAFFVSCGVSMQRGRSGIVLLLLLSLPLLASLDFYAGYPLRLVTAEISAGALQCTGLDVTREGVMLQYHDALIGVDPPCAGVRMLWMGLFVAAFLATRQHATPWHTISLVAVAFVGVLLANALRAAILFFPESGIVTWPHWTHEAVGLASYGCLLALLLLSDGWLARKLPFALRNETSRRESFSRQRIRSGKLLISSIAGAFALAIGIPFAMGALLVDSPFPSRPDPVTHTFNEWPATFDGVPLQRLPLSAREEQFAHSFPGAIARFRCGDAEIIMRHVTRPTRRLHSSADCLRAMGWQIVHQPVLRDADGRIWGHFEALTSSGTYIVTERMTPSSQTSTEAFTDVSAWYWNALWNPNTGPWLAVTIVRATDVSAD
ncbi:exosortase [Roseimicrobium gellanilyticum]|uniref:Exosortase n=1 Tax=Roseimicrobium gellanilyticum TaxID=748857 RepID=A0A366HSG4_9BACT|nr:exosortase/archaeosortase family protein [Roseimicrobium gellanilyticum]RBP46436.1 exosortase [Roseimicrobium gellanilyticum]